MRKLFQQIDDLCKTASIAGIYSALKLEVWFDRPDLVTIRLNGKIHNLPGSTDRLWRRKWRKFLTDHVDDVAKNLDAGPAAAHASQSGSAV